MKLGFRAKIVLLSTTVSALVVLTFSVLYYNSMYTEIEEKNGIALKSIVTTAAIKIRGENHLNIQKKTDFKKSEFKKVRNYLVEVMRLNKLSHETIYTFSLTPENQLKFAVMLHKDTFIGSQYFPPLENRMIYRDVLLGASAKTKIYQDDHGSWISGIAPIKQKDGMVVGLLQADKPLDNILSDFYATFAWLLFAGSLLIIFAFIASYMLSSKLMKPVSDLSSSIVEAEKGNFTETVSVDSEDEIGTLAIQFNKLIKRFADLNDHIKTEVNSNANLVSGSAKDVLDISTLLKESANGQAAEIEEATAALNHIHEVLLHIEQNSNNQRKQTTEANKLVDELNSDFDSLYSDVNDAYGIASGAGEKVRTGNKIVSRTITDIDAIQKKSENLTELIELLNSISEKLQMLSLNASIEAARAGEAHSGFQVVANEITELSDKTTRSTSQAIDQLKDVTKSVSKGAESLKETVKLFDEIFASVSKLSENLRSLQGKSSQYLESTQLIDSHLNTLENLSNQIGKKINEAANSEREVLETISLLGDEASMVAAQSEQVNENSHKLSQFSDKLRSSVS